MVKATAAVLVAGLTGAAAFSAAPTSMKFGGRGSKSSSGAKTVKKAGPPSFLREPEVGSGTPGPFFVREDPSLSQALPWVDKPDIADGVLIGDFGFDPLSLAKTFDVSWLRAAELKHGRVCMLAAVGLVAPELVQHPIGFEGFHFAPEFSQMNAIAALGAMPKFGLAQIILACGLVEIATFGSNYNSDFNYEDGLSALERQKITENDRTFLAGGAAIATTLNAFGGQENVGFQKPPGSGNPGDLNFDPLGFAAAGVRSDFALAEIKHARLAMIGVAGMLAGQFFEPTKGVLQQTLDWAAGQA